MKRQPNGVNLDEGLALETEEEMGLFFVDALPDVLIRLVEWFNSVDRESMLFGGQIGMGKSTLLNALSLREKLVPDFHFTFDRKPLKYDPGGFWGYMLAELVTEARKRGLGIPGGFTPEDLLDTEGLGWPDVCTRLTTTPQTAEENDELAATAMRIADRVEIVASQCRGLLKLIEDDCGRPLRLLAEGVDKFPVGSTDLIALRPVLNVLAEFKTLFEVNAVHLFGRRGRWQENPRICVPPFGDSDIEALLEKRLGLYCEQRRTVLPALVGFSGGNPRQALRLLVAYDHARGANRLSITDAVGQACRQVRSDYLYLPFEVLPDEILATVQRDGFIRTGIVVGAGPRTEAGDAIHKNWIVLGSEPGDNDHWPAILNPLLQGAVVSTQSLPDSPEMAALKRWAKMHDISPYGVDFNTSCASSVEVWNEISSSTSGMDVLNITELLDTIAASLFLTTRQDRVLIAYRDADVMATARDYFIGKANEMGYFPSKTVDLGTTPAERGGLMLLGALKDERVIYNVILPRGPDRRLLQDLDRRRDAFATFEMLWWVHVDDLPSCLQQWTQLRQLMSVYLLEDELLGSLSPKDLQGDLDYLAILEKSEGVSEAEARLKHVLNVVRERRLE